MTIKRHEIQEIINQVSYKPGWRIIHGISGDRDYLQVEATTLDAECGHEQIEEMGQAVAATWRGGKRYLSPHMCRQEIVGICFDLFKAAEDHEMREWFRYRGTRIYCPHIDPDWLAENATPDTFSVRENAMTMEEPT